MGRPTENRTATLKIRVTEEERELMMKAKDLDGRVTLSDKGRALLVRWAKGVLRRHEAKEERAEASTEAPKA
ncbi:MAG: hypothetical protein HRU11_12550 [Parvularculaceae bacterium]|nr:hypothetical protein [Parvularculaceae bacterium]